GLRPLPLPYGGGDLLGFVLLPRVLAGAVGFVALEVGLGDARLGGCIVFAGLALQLVVVEAQPARLLLGLDANGVGLRFGGDTDGFGFGVAAGADRRGLGFGDRIRLDGGGGRFG